MTNSKLLKLLSKPWKPWAYQKKAVKFLLEHAAGALFLDPGLGKTSITLAATSYLLKKKVLNKVLIIAPLRVCYNVWPAEIAAWKDFNHLRVVVLHGPHKEDLLSEDADIYVINPEGLEWLLGVTKDKTGKRVKVSVNMKRWKKFGFDTLVVDELTKFKNTQSIRFKALKQVLSTFRRRWGLTGSPAANGLMGLFGQCYVIDQGRSLGQYITHYRNEYFVPGYDGFSWTPQAGAEQRIYERVSPIALRMSADDYLDMPKLVENIIKVVLPDKARRAYDTMEADMFLAFDQGLAKAGTSAVVSGKCRQIANGGIFLSPDVEALIKLPKSKREWVDLHSEKTDAVVDLIDELQGSPLLVGYDFEHDLARLRAAVPKGTFACDYTPKQFKEIEDSWNNGEIETLFAHPASVAHGLNLQKAGNHICFHSMIWDYELFDQFIRRVRRQGNTKKRVFLHLILAEDTIDEALYMAIKAKASGQNALFKALLDYQKRRK